MAIFRGLPGFEIWASVLTNCINNIAVQESNRGLEPVPYEISVMP